MKHPRATRQLAAGFALIEILIALLVLAASMLGFARLQLLSLRDNQAALQLSQAALLANDLADRIRANPLGDAAGNYQLSAATAPSDPGHDCADDLGATSSGDACTPAELAAVDLFEWWTSLRAQLPASNSVLVNSDGIYRLTVMWDEARSGATGTDCSGDIAVDVSCFNVAFSP